MLERNPLIFVKNGKNYFSKISQNIQYQPVFDNTGIDMHLQAIFPPVLLCLIERERQHTLPVDLCMFKANELYYADVRYWVVGDR